MIRRQGVTKEQASTSTAPHPPIQPTLTPPPPLPLFVYVYLALPLALRLHSTAFASPRQWQADRLLKCQSCRCSLSWWSTEGKFVVTLMANWHSYTECTNRKHIIVFYALFFNICLIWRLDTGTAHRSVCTNRWGIVMWKSFLSESMKFQWIVWTGCCLCLCHQFSIAQYDQRF